MRKRLGRTTWALGLILAAACGSDATEPSGQSGALSPGRLHLQEMRGIMGQNSLHRLKIDWRAFDDSIRASSSGAVSIPDIGYVRVRSISGTTEQAAAFAQALQDSVRARDRDGLVGWIVDVRGNGGGNMWPMIAGVGPILGEGWAGSFIDPVGTRTSWGYWDGASQLGGTVMQSIAAAHKLRVPNPKVAVLTDSWVASSGEAVVVAFRARPQTHSFGTATCGLSTANRGFTLTDGALLNLTVSVVADRAETTYGDRIEPDETITDPVQVVERAVAWLRGK